MTESEVIYLLAGLASGAVIGVLLTLGFNKVRGGRVTAAGVRKEMDEYQAQVEAHFDETSKKFKSMAEQYKDLYQHLSVGATSLCRPDNIAPGLTDKSDPLQSALQIEAKAAQDNAKAQGSEKSTADSDNNKSTKSAGQKPTPPESKKTEEKPSGSATKSAESGQRSSSTNKQGDNSSASKTAKSGKSISEAQNASNDKSAKAGNKQVPKSGAKSESKSR